MLEKGILKEIRIDKIDECCSALLLSTDSILRGYTIPIIIAYTLDQK